MSLFLLVYDRSTQSLVGDVQEFADADRELALSCRFEAEEREAQNPDLEVVLLAAQSREALQRTHARYFKHAAQIAHDT